MRRHTNPGNRQDVGICTTPYKIFSEFDKFKAKRKELRLNINILKTAIATQSFDRDFYDHLNEHELAILEKKRW